MENPKFQIFKDRSDEFRFRLKARNGEIILQSSEGYDSKQGCKNGIDSVKANAPFDSRYSRLTASNGQYYFILNASNGRKLGISEMYVSSSGRDNGIEAVKRDAPGAPTEDLAV
jgi:uncharacterized protein YegP (UPF0339 family)